MANSKSSQHFTLTPAENQRLLNLCGQCNENIRFLSERLYVDIKNRGFDFTITGGKEAVNQAVNIIQRLYKETNKKTILDKHAMHLAMQSQREKQFSHKTNTAFSKPLTVKTRSDNQQRYVERIWRYPVNFGIGPAGTGKTFLAAACAVDALLKEKVQRIILVRPAVEAGEKLGFLPGDLVQKVDPYLRPLYDSLFELLGVERADLYLQKGIIEIAPLAYMRGRTLNNAFIILDEGQNTTPDQMKMFLTRIGFSSTAVVNGDVTQTDLPTKQCSGLLQAIDILKDIPEISFTFFEGKDIVRHPIVQNIISAYENFKPSPK